MRPTGLLLVLVAWASFCGAGCDRGKAETQPATTQAASAVPATLPSTGTSVLNIAGRDFTFGPPRLTLQDRDGTVLAQLVAEAPGGNGDGYYLEMPLEIEDPSKIDGASWQFTAAGTDRADSTNGVTLDNGVAQLQPKDVAVVFRQLGDGLIEVRINGFFNVFATREATTAARSVAVSATIVAREEGRGS